MQVTTELYDHQKQAIKATLERWKEVNGFALFMDMGTGKTLTSIQLIAHLFKEDKIDKVLVACPLSIMYQWRNEFIKHTDIDPVDVKVAHGNYNDRWYAFRTSKVVIINFDGLKIPEIAHMVNNYCEKNRMFFIVDESSFIKNYKTNRTLIVHFLGDHSTYKLALSGAPITTGAENIWAQYRFTDPSIFGDRYWSFVNRYLNVELAQVDLGHRTQQFKKIVGINNLKGYQDGFNKGSFVIKKEDCLDLPEKIFMEPRRFELKGTLGAAYKRAAKEAIIQLENKELTLTHRLAVLAKLRQIRSGFVYDSTILYNEKGEEYGKRDAERLVSTKANPAAQELELLLEELNPEEHKIIIVYQFNQEMYLIDEVIRKFTSVDVIPKVGSTFKTAQSIETFRHNKKAPILIGQIQRLSHGLDLSFADVMIHFSHYWSTDLRRQVFDRIHRIGQTKKCLYVDLVCSGTIDETIIKIHERNIKLSDYLVRSNLTNEDIVYGR